MSATEALRSAANAGVRVRVDGDDLEDGIFGAANARA